MKTILLYSDVDYFIIAIIALIIAMVLFNLMIKKLSSRKKETTYVSEEEVEIDLSSYLLKFDVIPIDPKTVSFASKLVVFALALAIVFIPLYEFIVKLTPEVVYCGRSYILF